MRHTQEFYPESRFGGYTDIDGTVAFYTRVSALLQPESSVVDFGCGRGAYGQDPVEVRRRLRVLRGRVHRVIGLDVDGAGADNPHLDEFCRLQGSRWPLPDSSVDLVLADNVLEHLPDPQNFFTEARRVLKSGGNLCVRTPNAWSYIALLSRLIPNRDHAVVLAKVKERSQADDVFPTLYRCNSLPAVRRMMRANSFEGVAYGYEAEPSYLDFSRLAYALGVLHQKFAPGWLRPSIFAFACLRK